MNKFDEQMLKQYRFGMLGAGQDNIVERYLNKYRAERVLHVGSSSRLEINRNVSSLVNKVFCGDIDLQAMFNLRAHKFPNVVPVVLDVLHIPFKDEAFDFVLAIGLQPLYSYGFRHPIVYLAGLHQIISEGGELLVCNKSDGDNVWSISMYKDVAEKRVGYSVVEENVAPDNESITGAKERYVLVLKK